MAIAASYTYEFGEKFNAPEDAVYIKLVDDADVRPRLKT
jgi:hypothetical protein